MEGQVIAIVSLFLNAYKVVSPAGIARLKTWTRGKKLVVVGPARSGKTSFVDYLRHGVLEQEQRMVPTIEERTTANFHVSVSQAESLDFEVRKVVDVPGQDTPLRQVSTVRQHSPDAIVLIVDVSKPLDTVINSLANTTLRSWLADFFDQLSDSFLAAPTLSGCVSCLVILLNQKDRTTTGELEKRTEELKVLLNERLRRGWGGRVEAVRVLPSILVANPEGTQDIDAAIRFLARCLL